MRKCPFSFNFELVSVIFYFGRSHSFDDIPFRDSCLGWTGSPSDSNWGNNLKFRQRSEREVKVKFCKYMYIYTVKNIVNNTYKMNVINPTLFRSLSKQLNKNYTYYIQLQFSMVGIVMTFTYLKLLKSLNFCLNDIYSLTIF